MTPRPRIRRRRRTSSRHVSSSKPALGGALAALFTTFLLAIIVTDGPLILGGARLWIELPLLAASAVLILIQGLRLTAPFAPEAAPRADAIDLTVLLFVLYAVIRWLTSPAEYISRIEVLAIVAYAGLFLTCRHGMANRRYCMALLYALVALGVGETLFAYYLNSHADWFPFGPEERLQQVFAPRWLGTYESPNHFVTLLVMAIGAALALGSFSKLPWAVRVIFFYVALMMIIGVIFSGSRGGWLALLGAVVALVIVGIRNGTMRWWIPVLSGFALLVFSAFLLSVTPEAQVRLTESQKIGVGKQSIATAHLEAVEEAFRATRGHLLFGQGPGTDVFINPQRIPAAPEAPLEPTHGDFLNCLDDYGVVGIALALFFVVAVTLKFFRPLWVDNRWQDRVLVATGFATWIAVLVHSLIDFNLHIPGNAFVFFSLTGLALSRIKPEAPVHWSTVSLAPFGRSLGGATLVLGLLYGVEVARTAASDNIYEKAIARAELVPVSDSLADADQALRYDSGNVDDMVFSGDLHRLRAELQKDSGARAEEAKQAIDDYQQAEHDNPLDDSVPARIETTKAWMEKNAEAPAGQ